MSLWSISAAKKREDVPGSSKWIRKELYRLHELIAGNAEQFAYSVASELTWIDEQMEAILNDDEKYVFKVLTGPSKVSFFNHSSRNPKLLLESPSKLRGKDSPIKRLREQAFYKRYPLGEIDGNSIILSPIKFSPELVRNLQQPSPKADIRYSSPSKVAKTVRQQTEASDVQDIGSASKSLSTSLHGTYDVAGKELRKLIHFTDKVVQPVNQGLQDEMIKRGRPRNEDGQEEKGNEDEDKVYNISLDEDVSFQAIRKSIRKSIIRRGGPSTENENTNTDTDTSAISYKSAADEGPQPSSLVVNQGSAADISGANEKSEQKIFLKDKYPVLNDPSKISKATSTPIAHRESQGFALLPQRDPLTIKFNKVKRSNGSDNNNLSNKTSPSKISGREEKQLPNKDHSAIPVLEQSLYPSLEHEKLPVTNVPASPMKTLHKDSSELNKETDVKFKSPKENPTESSNMTDLKPSNSPLSNLFTSVGSTLRKAKNFLKDRDSIVDGRNRIHKPERLSAIGKLELVQNLTMEKNSKPGTVSEKPQGMEHSLKESRGLEGEKSSNEKISLLSESRSSDDFDSKHVLFSPAKSVYGSLRAEMNKSVNSPLSRALVLDGQRELETKPKGEILNTANIERESFGHTQTKLTRISLSKSKTDDVHMQPPRKSTGKGLVSVPLEPSNKNNRFRPKSLVHGDNQPLKRKTQTEDEAQFNSSHQPYRKIGTKIVAPSVSQSKQVQQDAKRRRTADQIQSVLEKRALSLSGNRNDNAPSNANSTEELNANDEHKEDKNKLGYIHTHNTNSKNLTQQSLNQKLHPKYHSNQALIKTAVLQNATKEYKKNPFQSTKSGLNSSNRTHQPMTPKASTVLPEIFSESEDDEEGNVLKEWANSPELRSILINQQHMDPDKVFGPIAPLHMEEIFKNSRLSRLRGRGSSAQWIGKDALTTQEIESYKSKTFKQ